MTVTITYDLSDRQAAALARIVNDYAPHPVFIREVWNLRAQSLDIEVVILAPDHVFGTRITREGEAVPSISRSSTPFPSLEPDVCREAEDGKHQVTGGSCDLCGAKNFN